jgi:hypothetical protein
MWGVQWVKDIREGASTWWQGESEFSASGAVKKGSRTKVLIGFIFYGGISLEIVEKGRTYINDRINISH